MRLAADQQEDGFEDFVGDGDNGALVSSSQAQCLELRLEGALGAAGGMGELAQQAADPGVALTDAPGLPFPGRLA